MSIFSSRSSKPDAGTFKAHDGIASVADIVNEHLATYGKRPAIRYDAGSEYRSVSFDDYRRRIVEMIRFFQAEGAEHTV